MQQCKAILPPNNLEIFQDGICLFPSKKQVEEHKQKILYKWKSSVAKILVDHYN